LKQLEDAGLVGKVTYHGDNGSEVSSGKTLTKRGTTDMDRIATAIVKAKKQALKK
jgi:ribosomal protein S19E (S16A)